MCGVTFKIVFYPLLSLPYPRTQRKKQKGKLNIRLAIFLISLSFFMVFQNI